MCVAHDVKLAGESCSVDDPHLINGGCMEGDKITHSRSVIASKFLSICSLMLFILYVGLSCTSGKCGPLVPIGGDCGSVYHDMSCGANAFCNKTSWTTGKCQALRKEVIRSSLHHQRACAVCTCDIGVPECAFSS